MACTFCDAPVPAGARYCPNCGTAMPPGYSAAPVHWKTSPAPLPGGETNSTAVLSLVFGIVAWTILPIIGAVVAVVTGHMARDQIREAGGSVGGWGLATAGLVLGYIQVIPLLIVTVVVLAGLALAGVATLGLFFSRGVVVLGVGTILIGLIGL
jgi:hypothetical protein